MIRPNRVRIAVFLMAWIVLAALLAGRLDFWGDEIGSIEGASEPVRSILRGHGADFHPPLYFLALHFWQRVFGPGEYATRALSVIASAAAILLTAAVARDAGLTRPWVASLLLALSPFWVLFCGMARYYGLSAMFFLMTLLALSSAIRVGSAARWVTYAVILALDGYTNYLMLAAVMVTHAVWVYRFHRRCTLRWVLAVSLAALLLIPLAALVLEQTRGMIMWGERASFAGQWRAALVALVYPFFVLAVSETVLPWRYWLAIPLLVASGFLVARSARPRLHIALGCGIVAGLVVVVLIARSLPLVYLPSRLLFLAPIWAVLLAAGAERSGRAGRLALLVLALGYGGGLWNLARGADYHNVTYLVPWRQIVEVIRNDPEDDRLVVTTEEYPLLYYGRGLRFQLIRPGERVTRELAQKGAKVVWLVQRDRADRQRQGITSDAEAWLEANYIKGGEWEYLRLSSMELRVRRFLLRREPSSAALTVTRFLRTW
jgi:4-amino-4-deoxy-L-arabinose transferase-like glycosyltransferase